MPYIGRGPAKSGAFRILDDVSGSFNGSTTSFALTVGSAALTVGLPETLLIAVDGVVQEAGSAYTISGSNIVFTAAPQADATFWGVELGDVGGIAEQAITQSANDNTTNIATTAYVQTELGDYAPLAAPTFTGNAAAVTQAGTDDSTRIATTAHVKDVKIDDLAAGDDNTDLDSSASRHGLLLKLGGGTTNFLRADGTWNAPSGGATINNATANELVTVASTTTQLDAEANLTFDGTNLTVGTGNVIIGTAGKGIDFSAQTPSSSGTLVSGGEVFDHYEEGTWTPVAKSSGGVALSQQSNGDEGKYTRIGNVVYIQCRIIINGFNSANTGHTLLIYGLPFTHINGHGTLQSHFTCGSYALGITAGESIHAQIEENQAYISIMVWDETGGLSNLTLSEFSSDGQVGFTGHYFAS